MHRLLPLFSALMLALMVWSGSAAHAIEVTKCGEVASGEVAGHFEGDGDEVPADAEKGVPHHHGTCHGHCVGVPTDAHAGNVVQMAGIGNRTAAVPFRVGASPGAALRPPIA